MQVIQHQELASAQASITFSSIPQTYTDLYLVVSGRSVASTIGDDSAILFNDSTTGYSSRRLYGYNSATASDNKSGNTSQALTGAISAGQDTANTFGSVVIYIPNYTASTSKTVSSEGVQENNGIGFHSITASSWSGTAAITKVTFQTWAGSNLAQYSSATLYGILKGSDGIVTVS